MDVREENFEDAIENYLITQGGYSKKTKKDYDKVEALDKVVLFDFIKISQPKAWERYERIYGVDAEKCFIQRLNAVINKQGLINVLRKGFDDRGVKFRLLYFKPETSLNATTIELYEKNILTCFRQLRYSMHDGSSLDMVLFINGIPIVTLELKNQFTGQVSSNASLQYMKDRNPNEPIFVFKKRCVVHFAVDLTDVQMTTRLAGYDTMFFPFNQGDNGAGNVGGKGNPVNKDGFMVHHLWENVLRKDCLLDILHKFVHQETKKETDKDGRVNIKESIIFPRYHQLDVVMKLLSDVKARGSGSNYLIQHSAGSGKSNSIAWLAHRLAGLHNDEDINVFSSIIVVTDRKVLDSQLQDTIYQFDHVSGVVEKIDGSSKDLRDAINNEKKIIITTLQKFPVIFKEVRSSDKRFAVIIDEAHSSQTGEAAKKLKRALADKEAVLKEYAEMEYQAEENTKDDEDKIIDEISAHGNHANLSFFAFTATPKNKTLQQFGMKQLDGTYRAFHIYSMRQAIEEGFIIDVLKNYVTYKMYYKVIKTAKDDPKISKTKGMQSIAQFESLHPHNLSQKTAIIMEHFKENTRAKIGGKAKAMLVTASRLHAVSYYFEFKKYLKDNKIDDIGVLVAFSGIIADDGVEYSEEKLNKRKDGSRIKENQLKEAFNSDDFHMLIVAEKYQTGFDEPLLHTMFVDKKLNGVKAVQTLSRLNRTHKGKEDTFVLDFVNDVEDIQKAFQPYYEATILEEETNPNVIYDTKQIIDEFKICLSSEIEGFAKVYFQLDSSFDDMGRLTQFIKPALDRFNDKEEKEQEEFKSILASFIRVYSFITQVYRMFDKDMHKFFIYSKFLQKFLPKDAQRDVNLDDKMVLEYYRLEKTFEGSIELEKTEGKLPNIKGVGIAKTKDEEELSKLIDSINKRFSTNFTNMDLVVTQMEEDLMAEEDLADFAKNNNEETFRHAYKPVFIKKALERQQQNDLFFDKMFNDDEFLTQVMEMMLKRIYKKFKINEKKDTDIDNISS